MAGCDQENFGLNLGMKGHYILHQYTLHQLSSLGLRDLYKRLTGQLIGADQNVQPSHQQSNPPTTTAHQTGFLFKINK